MSVEQWFYKHTHIHTSSQTLHQAVHTSNDIYCQIHHIMLGSTETGWKVSEIEPNLSQN